jgi:O-acetyl-ADP-ribose deacetylase
MPFQIVRNDITKMKVDAIVNAANSSLKMGGGVCGAIFTAAGAELLQAECDLISHCEPGQAVMTGAYSLPSSHIIHTVGPVWQGGRQNEAKVLESCYIQSLELARKNGLKSIAFPLISSGVYGYPKDEALHVAISAIGSYLLQHDLTVYLVVYDLTSFILSKKLSINVEKYIDDNYIEKHPDLRSNNLDNLTMYSLDESDRMFRNVSYNESALPVAKPKRKLEDVVDALDETFSQRLLRLIDERDFKDSEVYRRANIDRRLFSKIRSDSTYQPSKATAVALAIALKLNRDQTIDLLGTAGYTLSRSSKSDVIIEYFIKEGIYNLFEINQVLFKYDQPILGA